MDSDCNGEELCLADVDDDGFVDASGATVGSEDSDCNDPGEGLETDPATDCDDTESSAYPGATEIVADGIDQDCNGMETCYVDADGDGHAETTGLTMDSVDSIVLMTARPPSEHPQTTVTTRMRPPTPAPLRGRG